MAKGFYFECDFCGEIVKTDMSASLDTESWDVDLPEGWLTMQTPFILQNRLGKSKLVTF